MSNLLSRHQRMNPTATTCGLQSCTISMAYGISSSRETSTPINRRPSRTCTVSRPNNRCFPIPIMSLKLSMTRRLHLPSREPPHVRPRILLPRPLDKHLHRKIRARHLQPIRHRRHLLRPLHGPLPRLLMLGIPVPILAQHALHLPHVRPVDRLVSAL